MLRLRATYYSKEWEEIPKYSQWVSGTAGKTTFSCRVCKRKKPYELSNSGRAALDKHMDSNGHKDNMKKHEGLIQPTLFTLSSSTSRSIPPEHQTESESELSVLSTPPPAIFTTVIASSPFFDSPSYQAKKSVILLAHECVMSNMSQRTVERFVKLLPRIVPGNEVVKEIELGRTKLGYIIQFGLAVYYRKVLFNSLLPDFGVSVRFTSCFDEAFNPISKRKQMDVHVLYFDESKQQVVRSYIGSTFMGHATAEDTFMHFEKVHGDLDITHNLVQISMDGPNVNLKMLRIVEESRNEKDKDCNILLIIGSCGLHVLHGAYGTAQKKVKWAVDKFCKSISSIFKQSPARREDYLVSNGLMESHEDKCVAYLLPMKFCGHRWLENGKVIKRAISILPYLRKYNKFVKEEQKDLKDDNRFQLLDEKLGQKLLLAELEFSLYIANCVEPFLTFFQAERPLAVFLFERLKDLMRMLMEKFVRPELIRGKTVKQKGKIDLSVEGNLLPVEKVNIGHGAGQVLKKTTTVDAPGVKTFRRNCRDFLVTLVQKMRERSPLRYSLTLYLSTLSPTQIASCNDTDFLIGLFKKLCEHFVECRLITINCADRAEESYKKFVKSKDVKDKCNKFDPINHRLDDLFIPLLSNHGELKEIVKIVLILTHGNARVESGFSINENMVEDNMKERTLVSYRTVYDAVLNKGGVDNVDVSKEMIKIVDGARKRYHQCLEMEKEKQTAGEKRKQEKRALTSELNKAKAAKLLLDTEVQRKQLEADARIFQLELELKEK